MQITIITAAILTLPYTGLETLIRAIVAEYEVASGKPSGICEASLIRATIRAAASLRPGP